jgi:hypothetical protein
VFPQDNLVNVELRGKFGYGFIEEGLVDGKPAAPAEKSFSEVCSLVFAQDSRFPECLPDYFDYRWVEVRRLNGRRLLEPDALFEAFGQEIRPLICVFLCDIPTDRAAFVDDEAVVVLELVSPRSRGREAHRR